jgi:Lipocalin-like domain
MRHRAVLVFLFAISTAVSGFTQQRNAHTTLHGDVSGSGGQLVGTWRLISRVVRLENGTAVQEGLGTTPNGYLMYDSSGHMAVQLLRPDRPTAIDCSISGSAPSDNSPQLLNGYEAYFGTYTIDENNQTVTHHLEGALASADVGRNLMRQFHVSGDKLTIVVRTSSPKGRQIRTLTWERVR